LRRGAFDEPFGGSLNDDSGQYYADAYDTPFDLAIGLFSIDWPNLPSEIALFGPYELPPAIMGEPSILMEDLNYLSGDRVLFNQVLPLTHSNFRTSANQKITSISGKRMNGRSFSTPIDFVGEPTPFPASVTVPDPASTSMSLALEFSSVPDITFDGQFCLVPLRAPLPATLNIDYLVAPDINGPAGMNGGPPIPLDAIVNGPVAYDTGWNVSDNGYDSIVFETFFESAGPGDLGRTVFRRYLPAMLVGSGNIGPTPQPFAFPGRPVQVGVESIRGHGLPPSHVDLFGPDLETILQGLYFQAAPTCQSSTNAGYDIEVP